MPEAFVSDTATSRRVSRAVKAGKLRKLASRLYTRNLTDPPEAVVRRNLWSIVAGYFPGALIADRTALENVPAEDGSVCPITGRGKDIKLPGLTVRPRRGTGPLASDRPFIGGLYLSSTARTYLENMRPSRARGGLVARTLTRREIEERLDTLIRRSGEDGANRLRDEVRALAPELDMQEKAAELDALIGSLLGSRGPNSQRRSPWHAGGAGPTTPTGGSSSRRCTRRCAPIRRSPAWRPSAGRKVMRRWPSSRRISPISSRVQSSRSRRRPTSSFAASFPTSGPRTPATCSALGASFPTPGRWAGPRRAGKT